MKKGIVTGLILTALTGLFVYYIAGIIHMMNVDGKKDAVTTASNAPKEYLRLFKKNKKLIFDETVISKTRNPIVQFNYDGKFQIAVYQINAPTNVSLNKINQTDENDHITYNRTYNLLFDFGAYAVHYKSGGQDVVRAIYLNLFGDGTFTIKKNDSIAYYYSKAKSFYIKFREDGMQDFFAGTERGHQQVNIPMEVLLLKHAGKLYLLLCVANKEHIYLQPGTLLTLINNQEGT